MAVREEDQPTARAQHPRGLGQPALGVTPGRGTVLADNEVDARVRQSQALDVALEQRERRSGAALQPARGRELFARQVHRDRSGTESRQPGRDVCRARRQLEHVEPADLTEHPELALGTANRPHTASARSHMASAAASVKRWLTTDHSARLRATSSARESVARPA